MVILSDPPKTVHVLPPRWPNVDYDGAFARGVPRLHDLHNLLWQARRDVEALDVRVRDGNAWLDRHQGHEHYQRNLRRYIDLASQLRSARSDEHYYHHALLDQVAHLQHMYMYSQDQHAGHKMLGISRECFVSPDALWHALYPDEPQPAKGDDHAPERRPSRVLRTRPGQRNARTARGGSRVLHR